MPRFFFHVYNHLGSAMDEEGMVLDGTSEARDEAIRAIREIVGEEALHGLIDLNGRIEISDEAGDEVLCVDYREAVEVRTGD